MDQFVIVVEVGSIPDGDLQVHYLDVGQADATLFVHDDVTILIDTGDWQNSTAVAGYLTGYNIGHIDVVAITHPHADHIGGFAEVLDVVSVGEVWWSGSTTATQTFQRAADALERSEAAYEEPRAGQTTTIGPLVIDIVNPSGNADLNDLHDASLSMRITYGNVRFMFTGDAETTAEQQMVDTVPHLLDADILKLGHHGSSTSTGLPFLTAVNPQAAIYSAGANNQYGHPHPDVIHRVQETDAVVYGTPEHGTVTVTTDGVGYDITTGTAAPPTIRPSAPADDTASEPDSTADTGSPTPTPAGDGCIDLNTADISTLQQITHIGPDRAEQIVALRPHDTVGSLRQIEGIGPARLDDIISQELACVP